MTRYRSNIDVSFADRVCLAVILAATIVIFRGFLGEYAIDDSFIGYDNAENLVSGHGFSFNPGDRVLSTSAPLAVLLYAGVHRLNHADVLAIAQTFAALACLVIGFGGYVLARHLVQPIGALAGSLVLLGSPFTLLLWSHESYLCVAALILSLLFLQRSAFGLSAVTVGLACLLRPEALIAIPFMAWRVHAAEKRVSVPRFLAISVAPTIGWGIAAAVYFGSPFSQSIAAKHAQLGYVTIPYLYGLGLFQAQLYSLGVGYALSIMVWAAVAIVWLLSVPARFWRPSYLLIGVWSALYTLLYLVVGVPFFVWFAAQAGVVLALTSAAPWLPGKTSGIEPPHTAAARTLAKTCSMAIAVVNVVFLLVVTLQPYRLLAFQGSLVMPLLDVSAYRQLGDWLAIHTRTDDIVAYPEIGQLRYYSGRQIMDFEGLVNKGVPAHLAVGDGIWSFKRYRPTIYVDYFRWHSFVDPLEYDWFEQGYRRTGHVSTVLSVFSFDVYRLTDPSAIPPTDSLAAVQVRSIVRRSDAADFDFVPNANTLDQIDVRIVASDGCAHGSLVLTQTGHVIARRLFRLRSSPDAERVSLRFDPLPRSGAQEFNAVLAGCSHMTLAPPSALRHVRFLETSFPIPSPGPESSALSVYVRVQSS